MKTHPTLSKPPIKKALIDVRVKLSSDFNVYQLGNLDDKIRDTYPTKQEQRLSQVKLEFKLGAESLQSPQSTITKLTGFRYFSQNKDKIFQARLDGFTFNKLPPYATWQELRSYERFKIRNKSFIVSGGGGGPRHKVNVNTLNRHYEDVFNGPDVRLFHFCEIETDQNTIHFRVVALRPDKPFRIVDSIDVLGDRSVGRVDETSPRSVKDSQ